MKKLRNQLFDGVYQEEICLKRGGSEIFCANLDIGTYLEDAGKCLVFDNLVLSKIYVLRFTLDS